MEITLAGAKQNQIRFGVPKPFLKTLKGKDLVIVESEAGFRIREAIINDNKTFKISSKNQVSYTPVKDQSDITGTWEYEIENGELIIYR